MTRPSVFPASSYNPPEESFNHDMAATVEKSMKKYSDNLMRFLEGISSRLSQLELYCYNLDKSIGEMRSDLVRDNGEADTKLKSLEKHLQEVHRSVQILRDKQELADTQKELAKLQTGQKESSSLSHSQSSEERVLSTPASDTRKTDNTSDTHNQQLALVLPHQVAPQQQSMPPGPHGPTQNTNQQQCYYMPQTQLPTPQAPVPAPAAALGPPQHAQSQYMSSDPHYGATQLQDFSRVPSQSSQTQVNQPPAPQTYSQYQQQWSQQIPQQMQPSVQQQMRPHSPPSYPPYPPTQLTNQSPPEALPNNSMPTQLPFSAPQPVSDGGPYGYSAPGRTSQQHHPPPQQIKNTYGTQPGDGYVVSGPHPSLPPGSSYMIYENPPQPHFPQGGGYPPASTPLQNPQLPTGANQLTRTPSHPQFVRNHPYGELIEKLMSMGFRGDHVVSVMQRMEEGGQPIDFNSVLDRLNVHPSSGPQGQRGW